MARRATRLLGLTLLLAAAQLLFGVMGAAAAPIGMVCTNGPTFNLTARAGQVETPDGNSIRMWSYANADTGGRSRSPARCSASTRGTRSR